MFHKSCRNGLPIQLFPWAWLRAWSSHVKLWWNLFFGRVFRPTKQAVQVAQMSRLDVNSLKELLPTEESFPRWIDFCEFEKVRIGPDCCVFINLGVLCASSLSYLEQNNQYILNTSRSQCREYSYTVFSETWVLVCVVFFFFLCASDGVG
jgi:hypothetical protein